MQALGPMKEHCIEQRQLVNTPEAKRSTLLTGALGGALAGSLFGPIGSIICSGIGSYGYLNYK